MAISKEAQSVYDLAQFPLKPRSCNLLSDLRIQTRKKIEPSVESVLAEYSVSITEKKISGVNCTCINPEKILITTPILYGFGGGFVSGSAYEDLTIAVPISKALGASVIIPNYSLSPEFKWPRALNETYEVYKSVCVKPFMMMGESAGGNLVLALLQKAHKDELKFPLSVALISPWVDLSNSGTSLHDNDGIDPMLSKQHVDFAALNYSSEETFSNPLVSPINGEYNNSFPPIFISTGEKDLLLSQSLELKKILNQANIDVHLKVWEGMWHVFEWLPDLPESKDSLKLISKFFERVWALNKNERKY